MALGGSGATSKKKRFQAYLLVIGAIVVLAIFFSLFSGGGGRKKQQVVVQNSEDVILSLKVLVNSFNKFNTLAYTLDTQAIQRLRETESVKTGTKTVERLKVPSEWGNTPVMIINSIPQDGDNQFKITELFKEENKDKLQGQVFIYYAYFNPTYASDFGYALWYLLSSAETDILREIMSHEAEGIWGYQNTGSLLKEDIKPALAVLYRRSLFFPVVKTKDGKQEVVSADEKIPQGAVVVGFQHKIEQSVYVYDAEKDRWYAFPYKEVQRRIYATNLLPKDVLDKLLNSK